METYPAFFTPRDKEPSHSSSEETSSEFDLLEIKITRKQEYIGKAKQVLCRYISYYRLLHIWYMIYSLISLHWFKDIYIYIYIEKIFSKKYPTRYISYWSSGIQESNALNGVWIGVEMKKLWPFEDNCIKLCEISELRNELRNPPLAHECHFAAHASIFTAANHVAKPPPSCEWSCESSLSCEITSKLQNQS